MAEKITFCKIKTSLTEANGKNSRKKLAFYCCIIMIKSKMSIPRLFPEQIFSKLKDDATRNTLPTLVFNEKIHYPIEISHSFCHFAMENIRSVAIKLS
jgi:hypothetical protein